MSDRSEISEGETVVQSSDNETPDLTDDSIHVLAAIESLNGEATTSDIRSVVDFEVKDSNRKITYLVDEYLEPTGFVNSFQPDASPGKVPPREFSITESGSSYIESHEPDIEGENIDSDRLEALEERIADLEKENERLRKQLATDSSSSGAAEGADSDLEQRVDDINRQLADLQHTITHLESHPLLHDDKGTEAVNRSIILCNAIQRILVQRDILTTETVRQEYNNVGQELEESDNHMFPLG